MHTKHCTLYFRCSEAVVHNVQIPISTLYILLWKIYVQSNLVIISYKESINLSGILTEEYGNRKKKHFLTNTGLLAYYLNFYIVICFKFKLQLICTGPHFEAKMWKDNMKLSVRKIVCENGKWLELAQDSVWWQALLLVVLNIQLLRKGIFFFGQLMSFRARFVEYSTIICLCN